MDAAPEVNRPNAVGIFHININCTDLERSATFYELIGFRRILDFQHLSQDAAKTFHEIGLAPILGVPDNCEAQALFLILGDDLRATRLDLIQWTSPPTQGQLPGDLTAVGVPRICIRVRNAWEMQTRLLNAGYNVIASPMLIEMGGTRQWVFCCRDPDGLVVEFMEFLRTSQDETNSAATLK